jgi:hypothetical protein
MYESYIKEVRDALDTDFSWKYGSVVSTDDTDCDTYSLGFIKGSEDSKSLEYIKKAIIKTILSLIKSAPYVVQVRNIDVIEIGDKAICSIRVKVKNMSPKTAE